MGGRSRNRASGTTPVAALPAVPVKGNPPSNPPGPLPETSGTAPRLVPAGAAAGLTAPVVVAQVWGTDNAPIEAARPKPAEPAEPADQSVPVPEPSPATANPGDASPWLTALAAGINAFAACSTEPVVNATPAVAVIAGVMELNDELNDDNAEVDDPDEPGEASR